MHALIPVLVWSISSTKRGPKLVYPFNCYTHAEITLIINSLRVSMHRVIDWNCIHYGIIAWKRFLYCCTFIKGNSLVTNAHFVLCGFKSFWEISKGTSEISRKMWNQYTVNMHLTDYHFCVWFTTSLNCDAITFGETVPRLVFSY